MIHEFLSVTLDHLENSRDTLGAEWTGSEMAARPILSRDDFVSSRLRVSPEEGSQKRILE